ncbi:hypothetical protein DLREEDagr8_33600 [Dongia sp. agr-C8]
MAGRDQESGAELGAAAVAVLHQADRPVERAFFSSARDAIVVTEAGGRRAALGRDCDAQRKESDAKHGQA